MFPRFLLAAVMAAAMLPTLVSAAPLGLDQALQLAAERSQILRAASAGVLGAVEAARAAGQLPDPMLSVGIDNLPVTGPERLRTTTDSMTMKRIGISQEWVPSGKRALRTAAAQARVGREAALRDEALAETRLQTALAYLDAYFASEALKLTELTEHHVHEELEAAKARLASATGSSQEVLALTAARGVAEDDSAEVAQAQEAALVALQRWIVVRPDSLAPPELPPTFEEAAYVASHPRVLAAQRELEVARSEASVAASDRRPNWTWQLSYGQRTGLPDLMSFGVAIPLPVAPAARQDREAAAKLALVAQVEAKEEEARRLASAEFQSLASDARRLQARAERYRAAVLTVAQQRTQAALAGYRSNQVPLMTVFEARHAEVEAQRKQLALQRDLAKARAQLAFKPVALGSAR